MCLADLAYRIFRSKKRIVNVAACQVDCSAWKLFSVNQDLYLQDSKRYKKRYGFSFIYLPIPGRSLSVCLIIKSRM